MFYEFRELMKDSLFRGFVLFVAVFSFIAASVGWFLNESYTAWTNERNTIKQTSTVTLTVTKKGADNELLVGLPTRYYLILSNNEKVYMSYDDLCRYEEGGEYMFEQTVRQLITSETRPFKSGGE